MNSTLAIVLTIVLAAASAPAYGFSSSGTYTCPGCRSDHRWEIDERHLMTWDGKPYVPVATFWSDRATVDDRITDFNVWVDGDFRELGIGESEYFRRLDRDTDRITERGDTYILLVAYPRPPKRPADWLMDEQEISRMLDKWNELAPHVRKEGLRAVVLFNEINSEDLWRWRKGNRTHKEYGRAMGRLAKEAKGIFGNVPVLYKTLGTYDGFRNVLAGAVAADGLGVDLYPKRCSRNRFEPEWDRQSQTLMDSIDRADLPLGLFWLLELGRSSERGGEPGDYMSGFAGFSDAAEVKCYFDAVLPLGFTGFLFVADAKSRARDQYRWYADLKPYLQKKVLSRQR